jgi:hypothetical protein
MTRWCQGPAGGLGGGNMALVPAYDMLNQLRGFPGSPEGGRISLMAGAQ